MGIRSAIAIGIIVTGFVATALADGTAEPVAETRPVRVDIALALGPRLARPLAAGVGLAGVAREVARALPGGDGAEGEWTRRPYDATNLVFEVPERRARRRGDLV